MCFCVALGGADDDKYDDNDDAKVIVYEKYPSSYILASTSHHIGPSCKAIVYENKWKGHHIINKEGYNTMTLGEVLKVNKVCKG